MTTHELVLAALRAGAATASILMATWTFGDNPTAAPALAF